ncbi:hypothetical protein ACS0TY_005438 [Phlomoides rotata]
MEENSAQQPLLSSIFENKVTDYSNKTPFLISSAKWILRALLWLIFISWAAWIFLYPSNPVSDLNRKWLRATDGTVFGIAGSIFVVYSAPILVIAILGSGYVYLCGKEEIQGKKGSRLPRFRLWTFPVFVEGPFGVVSAAEVIGIVVFTSYVIWATWALTVRNSELVSLFNLPSKQQSVLMLKLTGLRLGLIGLFCMTFLFLPIARGSVLLRLIDIPFEHATRYHVWLGHLTMFLFTLHGLFYAIGWTIEGRLIHQLMRWKNIGVANLPGVISLVAGLLMWVTSLPGVRRLNFELFFYTHQLYVVFVVFLALHVGDFIFCYAAGAIFLFMLDRFLRFCQSRTIVDVVSTRCFPCGTLELVLAKPASLHYNALGWVFLQIRELSWLQWHPFSVSSSPLEGENRLAILIKVLGDWTEKLERRVSAGQGSETECSKITASVEGPYGHESPYHLTYENLILVAGGIGISPFLAILSDILHRINTAKPCLPRNVMIIWAVKTSNELPLLQTVDMDSICPNFSGRLNLEIRTYVTRESEPPLEEGKALIEPVKSAVFTKTSKGCGMSVLVGTGNIIWSGLYILASTVGLVITVAVLNMLYINPYKIESWWYKGLLFLACMVASILLFGGVVIGLWHFWEKNTSLHETDQDPVENGTRDETTDKSGKQQYINTVHYGLRPDFGGIFETVSNRWGNVDIGVIICGPATLQTSVAKECRTQNLSRRSNQAVFHFNSHTFDL